MCTCIYDIYIYIYIYIVSDLKKLENSLGHHIHGTYTNVYTYISCFLKHVYAVLQTV